MYTTYGLINILSHMRWCCMWGKSAMRLSVFRCARNVLFSIYVFTSSTLLSPSLSYSSTTTRLPTRSPLLSIDILSISSFRSSSSSYRLRCGRFVGERRKIYSCKSIRRWRWTQEWSRKTICGQVGFPFWKWATLGVDLSLAKGEGGQRSIVLV